MLAMTAKRRATSAQSVNPFEIDTATFVASHAIPDDASATQGSETAPQGLAFKDDGSKFYLVGKSTSRFRQIALSNPWDLSGGTLEVEASVENNALSLQFIDDGNSFMTGRQGHPEQNTLSTPWDLSSVSELARLNQSGYGPTFGLISPDGLRFVSGKNGTNRFFPLSTPFDITSRGSYQNVSLSGGDYVCMTADGLKHYRTDGTTVYQYSLNGTPGYIDNASLDTSRDFSAFQSSITGIYVSPDGSRLFMTNENDALIYEYAM